MQNNYLDIDMLSFLASADIEEYFNYFKSDKAGEFYYPAKQLLIYGDNSTEQHRAVLEKTKETLKKIAKENRMNHNRITSWLNIEVDKEK